MSNLEPASHLVQGTINGVARTASMTWVQPRVLDTEQISKMASRMDKWATDVKAAAKTVEDNAQEILIKE